MFTPVQLLDPLRIVHGARSDRYDCPDVAALDRHIDHLRRRIASTGEQAHTSPTTIEPTSTGCSIVDSGSPFRWPPASSSSRQPADRPPYRIAANVPAICGGRARLWCYWRYSKCFTFTNLKIKACRYWNLALEGWSTADSAQRHPQPGHDRRLLQRGVRSTNTGSWRSSKPTTPAVLVGADTAPTPAELLLNALGACLISGLANIAAGAASTSSPSTRRCRATSTCSASSGSTTVGFEGIRVVFREGGCRRREAREARQAVTSPLGGV
jgi:hypothetical protein